MSGRELLQLLLTAASRVPWERLLLGVFVIFGFVLATGTLAFYEVPDGNRETFAQALGVLGTALGAIIAATFKSNKSEDDKTQALVELLQKMPDHSQGGTSATRTSRSTSEETGNSGGLAGGSPDFAEPTLVVGDDLDGDGLPDVPPSQR